MEAATDWRSAAVCIWRACHWSLISLSVIIVLKSPSHLRRVVLIKYSSHSAIRHFHAVQFSAVIHHCFSTPRLKFTCAPLILFTHTPCIPDIHRIAFTRSGIHCGISLAHCCHFQLNWLSYSYKLIKTLSVCLCGTNHNRCTQRLVIWRVQTYQWNWSHTKTRSVWPTLRVNIVLRERGVHTEYAFSSQLNSWSSQPMGSLLVSFSLIFCCKLVLFACLSGREAVGGPSTSYCLFFTRA